MPRPEIYLPREYLPKVPDPVRAITGDQGKIEALGQRFFDEALNYLGMPERARRIFSQIHMRPLDRFDGAFSSFHLGQARITDDALIFLVVQDLPVASLFIRRDIGNYIQGAYALYLSPEYEKQVRSRIHNHSNERINYLDDPFDIDHFS